MTDPRAAPDPTAAPQPRGSGRSPDAESRPGWRRRWRGGWLGGWLGALLAVVLAPVYLSGLASDALVHGDEAYWIAAGSRAVERLRQGDWSGPDWQTGSMASVLDLHHPTETAANRNPKLGALLIGLGVHVSGAPVPTRWSRDYAFGRSVAWNRQRGLLPARETLQAGRLPVAMLGIAGAVALFFLLRALVHPGWAFAGALLFATSPLALVLGRRAMLDGPALFFGIGAVGAAALACRRPERWGPMLATGVLLGAALASKLNAGILVPVLVLAFGIEAWRHRSPALLLRAALAAGVALALFVGTNPTLYTEPLAGMASMLRIGDELGRLGTTFRGMELPTIAQRSAAAVSFLLVDDGVVGARLGLPLDLLLLPAGAALLARRAARDAVARLVLLWLVCAGVAVCLWPPVRWDRYFLPALPPVAAAETLALAAAGAWLSDRVARSRRP